MPSILSIPTEIKTSIVTDKVMTKPSQGILLKRIIIPDYHITKEISFILQEIINTYASI